MSKADLRKPTANDGAAPAGLGSAKGGAAVHAPAVPCAIVMLLSLGVLAVGISAAESPGQDAPTAKSKHDSALAGSANNGSLRKDLQPFLKKYCIRCHGGKEQKSDLRLDKLFGNGSTPNTHEAFAKIVDKLEAGEMPPEDEPMPDGTESKRVIARLKSILENAAKGLETKPRRVTVRRLNRAEYNNTIRDLIGVDFKPAEEFPSDDVGYGFDNIGDVLSLSPLLIEKYLDAAESILDRAIIADFDHRVLRERRSDDALRTSGHVRLRQEQGYKLTSKGEVFARFEFPKAGDYVLRAEASGDQAGDEPVHMNFLLSGKVVAEFDVPVPADAPKVYEARVTVQPGKHKFAAAFVNDFYNPEDPDPKNRDRNLCVMYLEVETPRSAVLDRLPESHVRLVTCRPDAGESVASCARSVLKPFVRRAYRRPVRDEEVESLAALVDSAVNDCETFERGIQIACEAVLVSPGFLFRVEREALPADSPQTQRLRNYELASRLSYFLWSSMPDEELFALAEQGTLRADDVLEAQVARMLADPKADALAENFAGQWLQLRSLDEASPDPTQFPEFDDTLRRDMQRESQLFFMSILREHRSLFDFIDGRFSYVNERLARLYGIPGIEGDEFREVSLSEVPRVGILTQASVLTVTSSPSHTSPVNRGKWVLENILGAPPPPPPPEVPDFEIAKRAAPDAPLRKQLEIHRSKADCAVCHKEMDTLGLGFENFDPIGRWRERDETMTVDAAGTLPSGESFRGPLELARILRNRQDEFRRCLIEKLLTYALGRGLEFSDRGQFGKIGKAVARRGDTFSALIVEIAKCEPFNMQRQREENP